MSNNPLKKNNTSIKKLYEGIDLSQYSTQDILRSKKVYNYIKESIEVAQSEGKQIDDVLDEGLLTGLVGGAVGATVGRSIMTAVCDALGLTPNSCLRNVLTSAMVLSAVGYKIGERW